MKSISGRSVILGLVTMGTAFAVLEACSSSSTPTPEPGTDSGVTTVRADSGSDAGSTGTDGGSTDTDSGAVPNGGPGALCTPVGSQGTCATGGICENFPNTVSQGAGNFCTKVCATPQQDPAPECEDAGAAFSGKCNGKGFCQIP